MPCPSKFLSLNDELDFYKFLKSIFFPCRKLTVRTDIKDDKVHRDINKVTGDVLLFLRQRDIFWDQLQSA